MSFTRSRVALFTVGAATLVLLFVGIHNAWDAVTYHVFVTTAEDERKSRKDEDDQESK